MKNTGLEFESASAGPDAIVIEEFGHILLYDIASGKSHEVKIHVTGDFPEVRPHFEKLDAKKILRANISPSGARAVFETHGEILTVPAEKGNIRNLTNSPSVADRDPAWSPDGKWIAYFSDESGEYALHVVAQNGLGAVKKINLGTPPAYFYTPRWSPDSKKIAYEDQRLNLWYVEVEKGTPVKVDTMRVDEGPSFGKVWSPDSRWLAYTKPLKNNLHAIFIYSLESGKAVQISDGMSDTQSPAFDRNGKYLYFTASTDEALANEAGMSTLQRPVTRSVYAAVLKKDVASPVAPESDEEKSKEEKAKEEKDKKDEKGADADKDKSKDKDKDKDKDKEKDKEKRERAAESGNRFRAHRPAHRLFADSRAQLRGHELRKRGRTLSGGRPAGAAAGWSAGDHAAEIHAEESQDGKVSRGREQLLHFRGRRENSLPYW